MRLALVLALALAARASCAGPVLFEYVTGHDATTVGEIAGLDLARARGISLTVRSEHPTQLALYLVTPAGDARFRYVVLSQTALERKLVLPLSAFDPDPRAPSLGARSSGALVVRDCPGMLRARLANRLAIGPIELLETAPPLPAPEVPPGPEAEREPEYARVLGGWLGKVAGGEAGMPREGTLSRDESVIATVQRGLPATTWGFGPDDDSSFEVMHLLVAGEVGPSFGSVDLVRAWVHRFAPEYLWKTERYALDAMRHGVVPPETGEGPLGESLCARIRSDLWGYLCPADPTRALELVGRDAPISNCREGIRAAEFNATAVSLAFRGGSVEELLAATLAAQPVAGSAHSEVVRRCIDDFKAGRSIGAAYARLKRETFDPIRERDPRNAWAYALPNAGLTTLALLYGGGDFARTVALATSLGWDTDCNAATAGCILGVLKTDAAIPASFKDPLHDRLRVAISGNEHWSIRRLAAETCRVRARFGRR